jgi:hypothetical protein
MVVCSGRVLIVRRGRAGGVQRWGSGGVQWFDAGRDGFGHVLTYAASSCGAVICVQACWRW